MDNKECYKMVKSLLSQVNISCCGYTEAGEDVTIYNSCAQLTVRNDHKVAIQVGNWLCKWDK